MINLLPQSHVRALRGEYTRRLLVVVLLCTLLSALLAILFLVPAYLLSDIKVSSLKERASIVGKGGEQVEGEEAMRELSLAAEKIGLLTVGNVPPSVHSLIDASLSERDTSIQIRSISYEKRGVTAKLDLAGAAKTRASLISFVERLKKRKEFAEVYSPVSNLVKDKDIEFSIQIAIAP